MAWLLPRYDSFPLTDEWFNKTKEKVDRLHEDAQTNPRYAVVVNRIHIPWKTCSLAKDAQVPYPKKLYRHLEDALTEYETFKKGDLTPHVALLGETGSGKSSFGNILLSKNPDEEVHFPTGADSSSITQELSSKEARWFGDSRFRKVNVIDIPGLNDPSCKDERRILLITPQLQSLNYITTFLLIFNGTSMRFTQAHKHMIEIFKGLFGLHFFTNLSVVFTHWATDEVAVARRKQQGISEEQKKEEFLDIIREMTEKDWNLDIPCYFVDSISFCTEEGDSTRTKKEIETLMETANLMAPYSFIDLPFMKSRIKDYLDKAEKFLKYLEKKERKRASKGSEELKEDLKALKATLDKVEEMERVVDRDDKLTPIEKLAKVSKYYQGAEQDNYVWSKVKGLVRRLTGK